MNFIKSRIFFSSLRFISIGSFILILSDTYLDNNQSCTILSLFTVLMYLNSSIFFSEYLWDRLLLFYAESNWRSFLFHFWDPFSNKWKAVLHWIIPFPSFLNFFFLSDIVNFICYNLWKLFSKQYSLSVISDIIRVCLQGKLRIRSLIFMLLTVFP